MVCLTELLYLCKRMRTKYIIVIIIGFLIWGGGRCWRQDQFLFHDRRGIKSEIQGIICS